MGSQREQAGLVISSHGRHVLVETVEGDTVLCHARGKRMEAVVGDQVRWLPSHGDGVITQVLPRRNLLRRQDRARSKLFAANLDQVLVMLAAEPSFSEYLLARLLIACEAEAIPVHVLLNKSDLQAPFAAARERLAPYADMGYRVLPLAAGQADARAGLPEVKALLARRVTLIIGPSGVGKSTLVNRLVPQANARTAEISRALHSGRHTTTHTRWYWLDREHGSALIDTPGFQEFGLQHLEQAQLARYMPDLAAHMGHCRFANCTHMHEPGCDVRAAVDAADAGTPPVSAIRYQIYRDLWQELEPQPY